MARIEKALRDTSLEDLRLKEADLLPIIPDVINRMARQAKFFRSVDLSLCDLDEYPLKREHIKRTAQMIIEALDD